MRLTGSPARNGGSPVLHQNVDDLPFLINGTPQVWKLTIDFQVHLMAVPGTSNWPSHRRSRVEYSRPYLLHHRRTVS
jgi:hypothetical protein